MGILYEDAVLIKEAEGENEHTIITVNCPDKTGLGCDLCRIILLFGLSIARGDVQTDGKWCYLVFWVVGKPTTRWNLLKMRLLEVCPSCTPSVSEIYYYRTEFQQPKPPDVFLLKFWCYYDRKGLLHGNLSALKFNLLIFFLHENDIFISICNGLLLCGIWVKDLFILYNMQFRFSKSGKLLCFFD